MDTERLDKMNDLIESIEVTEENENDIKYIKKLVKAEAYDEALQMLQELNEKGKLIELEIINRTSYIEYTLKNDVNNRTLFSNLG